MEDEINDIAKSSERFDDEDRRKLEDLRQRMEKLRKELEIFRKSTQIKDEDYHKLKTDLEYELLLRSGGFVQPDDGFVVKRIYPSLEEIFHERAPVVRDLDSINWKTIDNKIYIKEFFEDEEVLAEEMLRLKHQEAVIKSQKGKTNFGKNIKVEIPKEFKKDFENFVGENLTLKIGVLSIILAIIFGYNLMISEGLITRGARIAVGAIVGTAFFGLSYYLYLKRVSIVSILVTSGIVTLYYTVYLATFYAQQRDFVFTADQAFVWGVIITAFAVLFSLWYDKKELSYLAFFGGYLTPFLAGFHTDEYFTVLLYILVINLGMLTISYLKKWRGIHFVSFVGTVVFMGYWVLNIDLTAPGEVVGLFIFASVFHVVFYVMTVIFDIKPGIKFTKFDFYMSLANTLLYLWSGIYLLLYVPISWHDIGWFIAALGVFKMIYIYLLYGKENVEKNLLDLQIGAVILFINISIYLIFKQNIYINTLYALESLALLWVGIKLNHEIIKTGSVAMMLFAVASMGYAWHLNYNVYPDMYPNNDMDPIFNKGFWAALINFSCILFTLKFIYEDYKDEMIAYMPKMLYAGILAGLVGLISYLALLFEILYHAQTIIGGNDFVILIVAFYHMCFVLFGRYIVHKVELQSMKLTVGILMAILIVVYLPFGYFNVVDLRNGYLDGDYPLYPFLFHYLNVGLCSWMAYLLLIDAVKSEGYLSTKYEYAVLLACVLFVFFSTVEYEHLFVLFQANSTTEIEAFVDQFRRTSFTVLWTILSFVLMFLGMKWKIKEVRKISLFLFALTIVKFFVVDFWVMNAYGKIISFLVIGAILIVVSQMYRQQLRVLIESGEFVLDRDEQMTAEKVAALAKLRKEMKEAEAEEAEKESETEDSDSDAEAPDSEEQSEEANLEDSAASDEAAEEEDTKGKDEQKG
ncbi:MAG: DUF2339 domain-containing protein [Flammeovirgaceae bacterium]